MTQLAPAYYDASRAILRGLGAPLTDTNVNLVAAWIVCEKGWHADPWQWNNPLNTTRKCCNWIRDVNSSGVKEYPTRDDGIEATVQTINNGLYPTIRNVLLTSGNPQTFLGATQEISTWGTNPACISNAYSQLSPPPPESNNSSLIPPIPLPVPPQVILMAVGAAVMAGFGLYLLGEAIAEH